MENLQGEIWKPIIYQGIDYTGLYEVSNIGRVKSVGYGREKILKHGLNGNPRYAFVVLWLNKKPKIRAIHRLVISSFLGEIKKGSHIDHKNSNRLDNRLSNLIEITKRQNMSKERTIKSGFPTGVRMDRGFFQSQISLNSKIFFLGRYESVETASRAYQIALSLHEQGNNWNIVLGKIDEYRVSIGLKPVKRRNQ